MCASREETGNFMAEEEHDALDFATLAIAHKILTHDQIERAQEIVDSGERGRITVEQVLLEDKLLTQEEVWAIYKAQERLSRDAKTVGRKIGGYEIHGVLGQGGLGVVYRARQLSMGRFVALKVLHEKWVGDDEFRKRFLVEARLVGRLSHPNLIQVFDVGRYKTTLYYSMEFIDGETVETQLDRDGPMDVLAASDITIQIGRALQYLAGNKIVHRDVKPGNIMMTRAGVAKLGDFGFVKSSLDAVLSPEGEVLGTPDYISPEAARGDTNLDYRSDMYSLGATLYHMLAGRPPFGGSGSSVMDAHITKDAPELGSINPDVPERARLIVAKLMAKDPLERYNDYKELFEDLDLLRSETGPTAGVATAPRRKPDRHLTAMIEENRQIRSKMKLLVIGNIIFAVLVVVLLIVLLAR